MKKMKKLIELCFLAALALPWFSCKKFLQEEPKSFVATTNFYNTETDVNAAVVSIYAALRPETSNANWHADIAEVPCDDETPNNLTIVDRYNLDYFTYKANDGIFANEWRMMYLTISRANACLTYVDSAKFSPSIYKRAYAEARFMRAWSYFRLVQLWGDVPLLTEFVKSTGDVANLYPQRASRRDVYNQIIADLKYAEQNLDDKYDYGTERYGRATKGAAKIYLGKVYLTMAGAPMNGGQAYYQLAADKLKEVFDGGVAPKFTSARYGYELATNDADVFDYTRKSTNKEFVFAFTGTPGFPNNAFLYTRYYNNYIVNLLYRPTPEIVNEFVNQKVSAGTWMIDKRQDLALCRKPSSVTPFTNPSFANPINGLSLESAQTVCVAKYVDVKDGTDGANDFHLTRYTDAVLMYAEALIELGSSSQMNEALTIINTFRARANKTTAVSTMPNFNTQYTIGSSYAIRSPIANVYPYQYPATTETCTIVGIDPYTGYSTQDDLRQKLRKERRLEMCFEGHRWFDLVRWGVLKQRMIEHSNIVLKNGAVIANPTLAANVTALDKFILLFPVPFSELTANRNLTQNPGY